MPEDAPVLILTWVQTDLEGEVGFPGQEEPAWIRGSDSPGCTDCGSPGFTQSCFFRGMGLTKPISTNWAGSKQMLLTREQDCRAVSSSSGGEGDTLVPHPSLLTLSALQFCSQLFSVWRYKSPLFFMATFEISCCLLCKVSAFHHYIFLCECFVESSVCI